MARASLAPNPNTIERVRHDGGVSEATYVDGKWRSDDASLVMWLNQVAATGVDRALKFGCNPPGTEAKRQAEEAAKLAAEQAKPADEQAPATEPAVP